MRFLAIFFVCINLFALTNSATMECLSRNYDELNGGFGDEVKFLEASKIHLLMNLSKQDKKAAQYANETLTAMAMGGIYDQVDGGFYRYSLDASWKTPRLEKMLFVQAEMIMLYARAYRESKNPLFKSVVKESVAFSDAWLYRDGVYIDGTDAGMHEKADGYFTFSKLEFMSAVVSNKHKKELLDALGSTIDGNYESSNFSATVNPLFYTSSRPDGFYELRLALKKIRATKSRPALLSTANIVSNAMMAEALLQASLVNKQYAKKAHALLKRLQKPTSFEGSAFYISAMLAGYDSFKEKIFLEQADKTMKQALGKFYKKGVWYDDAAHKKEADLSDTHFVSAVSKMVLSLQKLNRYKKYIYANPLNQTMAKLSPVIDVKSCEVASLINVTHFVSTSPSSGKD